ncbi:bacteriohemerythrin [Rhodoferax sp.]|jgi:hemerythrin-like metal-binding protein|uniref:bacteriohemerythrin n=1 Tax=Rhodoferax sp. TaxID=50421 RepID=UPI00271D129D|nr:hemerythrin domain-containing protein [Rhodoferax sp.]MDO9144017.1 hemerythrin domain-containing protein [Rhodoferax sp.]MDP1529459.1 hemerythrin domain-containing protein [Rhodoferax sp.]MDP1943954.1 hemerythrin domain-containing protein [Rhodoferax sp.]MDP2441687.1 hemerythrin domain-containing protein [Rhodoferax sp.]MDP3190613.1 hemerythrin domain-containing protein [Rhodoferax sp.]
MPALQWTDSLALGLSEMDTTHQEFVALLAQVVHAPDDALLPLWRDLVAHTDDHFAREDRWMQSTGFAASNCHTSQHRVVLQVLREGDKRGSAGELAVVRQMADELGTWFPMHAQAMDAALALHLRNVGFDPVTGQVTLPRALPSEVIQGCGGATCSTGAAATVDTAVAA